MTSFVNSILSVDSVHSAYVLTTMLLSGLVVFALWRGRETFGSQVVTPLYQAIPLFAGSRIIIASSDTFVFGEIGFIAFSLLNFIGFYLLAISLAHVASVMLPNRKGTRLFPRATSTLHKQLLIFGAVGALISLLRLFSVPAGEVAAELVNVLIIAATLRVVLFALRGMFVVFADHKLSLRSSLMLFSASWLILETTPLLSETMVARAVGFTQLLDIAMLLIVITGLTARYVLVGDQLRSRASKAAQEMDAAKAELTRLSSIASNIYEDSSDVIKKQKEQTLLYMKKADNLERILQLGVNIQKRQELDGVLEMIVEMIRDNVGFKTVTLRLFNKKAKNFETRAFVGVSDDVKDNVVNYRIPITEYQKMTEPGFRISKSYFIKKNNPWYGEDLGEDHALVQDSWREINTLIVPLLDEGQVTVGYLSVENPENPQLSVADVIDTLESVATLAVIAIRNARFLKELEDKNEKLSIYAEKLAGLNKLKANFVQTVSHEFRTPLTSIKAYCETLIKNADTVERELMKQFLYVIDEESGRLMTLIEDILDFSHLESGATRFERTPCTIQGLVDQASSELAKNFDQKQIRLHRKVPKRDVVINGNAEMIKQLIVNLLHNASKFTKEEGNVWLTLQEDPGCARIVVEDDGVGIPDGHLARIFEQFYQVDNTSTRQHGGSGLGLAMCKNIIEWHDGKIWVEHMAGSGARFVAIIPKKEVVVSTHVLDTTSAVRKFEIERFLELLVENVAEFVCVDKASIMLIDKQRQELRIECAVGMDEEIVASASVKVGEGIAGKVAESGETLLVSDIEQDTRLSRSNNDLMYRSKSFLSVPIKIEGEVIGVVNVASPLGKPTLDDEDARLLETLVHRFSIAIEKMRSFADASAKFEQVRETFKAILDCKRYIDGRNFNIVKRIALGATNKLGLDDETRTRVNFLLNVYDIGLSKVGLHIIKNPKDLSPKDREEIHKHTITGHEMMAAFEEDSGLASAILYHHENYDGTGYPGNISGDAIPIEARIIRVADSLRALVSNRPYQRQYSLEEARDVLQHRAGTFFDPKVVDAFISVMSESNDGLVDAPKVSVEAPDGTTEEHS